MVSPVKMASVAEPALVHHHSLTQLYLEPGCESHFCLVNISDIRQFYIQLLETDFLM